MSTKPKLQTHGIYWDGKSSIRQILPPPEGMPSEPVYFVTLHGHERRAEIRAVSASYRPRSVSRTSFENWTYTRVPPSKLELLLSALRARELRIPPAAAKLLDEWVGRSRAVKGRAIRLSAAHDLAAAKRLAGMEVLDEQALSTQDKPSLVLTDFGRLVIRERAGEDVAAAVLGVESKAAKSGDNFVRPKPQAR